MVEMGLTFKEEVDKTARAPEKMKRIRHKFFYFSHNMKISLMAN